MADLAFWKMSGSGNDFILVDNRDGKVSSQDMSRWVERVCRRRESVGADGVIFVEPSSRCDFAWRFFNADGGEVEMCGNGSRCVARFAYLHGIAGPEMTFETLAGPISARVQGRVVTVRMPRPSDFRKHIDLPPCDGWQVADFINTGVPHVVIRVSDLEHCPVVEQGRWIRHHALFAPQGTNVNFVSVTGPQALAVRTYERGVEDETLACGTGSIASALVCALRDRMRSPVRVTTRGGEELTIHFQEDSGAFFEVWLEGNTSIVYRAGLGEEAL